MSPPPEAMTRARSTQSARASSVGGRNLKEERDQEESSCGQHGAGYGECHGLFVPRRHIQRITRRT